MADKPNPYVDFVFPVPGRLIYDNLSAPDTKYAKKDGAGTYHCTLVFPKDEWKEHIAPTFNKAIADAIKAMFPDLDISRTFKTRGIKLPYQDGDAQFSKAQSRAETKGKGLDKAKNLLPGHMVIRPKSQNPPDLAKPAGGQAVLAQADEVLRGDWFYAAVTFKAYEGDTETVKEPVGVAMYLRGLLFAREDDKLGGGRPSPAQVFAGVLPQVADVDDDDIPF